MSFRPLRGMPLEGLDAGGSERCPVGLCQKFTFLFWSFHFLRMFGDARGSTFDHSARIRPAIPGFPVLISRISAFLI